MAGVTVASEAILLTRRDSGEKGQLLTFLSPTHGILLAFKRRATSRGRQPIPDLFDEVSLTLEKGREGGDLWFVTEYVVRSRRSGLGANYESLYYACRFGVLLSRHLFPPEEGPLWYEQLRQALDAWQTGLRPEAAYFKSIYLFARRQGIPVKEDWLNSLEASDADRVREILRRPLAGQTVPAATVKRLVTAFESYLHHSHEIRAGG